MIQYTHKAPLAVFNFMKCCIFQISPPSLKLWRAIFAHNHVAKIEKLDGGANVTHQTV